MSAGPETAGSRGLSYLSLGLGVASLPWSLGFLVGVPAVLAGIVALWRIRQEPGRYAGKGAAIAGIAMGILSCSYPFLLPALTPR
jgi:hypothetical protein